MVHLRCASVPWWPAKIFFACGGYGAVGMRSASATVIGGLPLPVRQAIFGLFHLVYLLVKRYGSFTKLAADAETATPVGGPVSPAYRSPAAAREMAHAIARPIRAAGGELVLQVHLLCIGLG